MTPAENREFLWKVIGRYDTYLGVTNAKTAGVVALNAFIVGIVVVRWSDLVDAWSNTSTSTKALIATINFVLLLAIFGGVVVSTYRAVKTVAPRLDSPEDPANKYKSRIFFGHVADFTHSDYYEAINKQTDEEALRDCAYQANALARILNDKFKMLGEAIAIQIKWVVIPVGLVVFLWAIGAVQKLAGHVRP